MSGPPRSAIRAVRILAGAALWSFCFVFQFELTAPAAPIEGADDTAFLIQEADLVVMGRVHIIKKAQRETVVLIDVERGYKGRAPAAQIEVRHHGGSFLFDPAEPLFGSAERAILFLQPLQAGERRYRVVRGAAGKKTVRNDHVYLSPGNALLTVDLKKYEELLNRLSRRPG